MAFNGYIVQNVGTKLYVDLRGSNFQPGTDLIIYSLNQENGTRNQNWRLIPVDAGQNLYTIQSVLTGQFASADSIAAGKGIKSSLTSQTWEVAVTDTYSRNYTIKAPNTNLVWSVPSGSGATTVITLAAQSANTPTQLWTFQTII